MRRSGFITIGILLPAVAASVAIACGPDFPLQLLNERSQAIKEAPRNSFAFEAAHLVAPPSDSLRVVEDGHYWRFYEEKRIKAEKVGLTQSQADRVAEIREIATDAETAFAQGADLPAAVQQYLAGAVAFNAGDMGKATQYFTNVLTLGDDAKPRAVWASYMLARIRVENGDFAGALQMFEATRQQASTGGSDALGLAVASFGGEARLYLRRADDTLQALDEDAKVSADIANDLVHAVTLYAEEAARGSDSGIQSLREIALGLLTPADDVPEEVAIFQNPSRMLTAVVREPLIQRLIAVYLLANDGPSSDQARLNLFAEALAAADVTQATGVDRLAALAYGRGQYEVAARFAEKDQTPLAVWVRAKLAVQKGDTAEAAKLIAAATKSFAPDDTSLNRNARRRMMAESGMLSLSLHDYETALRQLLSVSAAETYQGQLYGDDYWGDVAHIAERVLTVDELKQFVDREAPTGEKPTNALLRDLLARRLMRSGRFADALTYFAGPKTRDHARDYGDLMKKAASAWSDVAQAQAYYGAAVLANDYGMEMMGTEGAPDFFSNGGDYDYGNGTSDDTMKEADADETARVNASAAPIARRFHYRFVAVGLAEKAADRLAPRSQAFAGVLCQATHWMGLSDTQEDVRRRLYRRYVNEGSMVPWAHDWGHTCQNPDFDRARFFGPRVWLESLYHRVARYFIRTR